MSSENLPDNFTLYGKNLSNRLLLGTAMFPSPEVMQKAILNSGTEVITLALRRQSPEQTAGAAWWRQVQSLGKILLPNTAGCHSAKEAITLAQMAREIFSTNWIKLEVIGDEYTLQPDPFELVSAACELIKQGFCVFPYCTDDLVVCEKLLEAGCEVLMPWGAPIGTGRGLINPYALATLRERLPGIPLIVDAGLGKPSHACQALELGMDAVLLNTAVAQAQDPEQMALAFQMAVKAGRSGYLAGAILARQTAVPSTPLVGRPFWHQSEIAI